MRKIIFIFFLVFSTLHSDAQIWSGTIAPDFTATDINGTQHSLSGYLQAGKTVILEFSSVGCGYSWIYLRTEELQDFYNAFGLPGSNEIVVLFIDDSSPTSLAELQGTSMPPGFGNWTEGTPFPIIAAAEIHTLYGINALPSI